MMRTPLLLALAGSLCCHYAHSSDWPQYLGPNRDSKSSEQGIARAWPEGGPKVLWSVPVGKGYGGPAIQDGKAYLLDRDDQVGDTLRCWDLNSGEELWTFAYDAPGTVMFPGSRSVPTIEGGFIYTCGHNGDLYCIDLGSHKAVWHANVWTDYGGKPPRTDGGGFRPGATEPGAFPIWAITQCPLIYGELLIVASQAPEAGVVAYAKKTGEVVWKTPSLGYVGYVSPSIAKVHGADHIVMVTPSTNPFSRSSPDENKLGTVVGLEPSTGKLLWTYDKWECHVSVPSAVDAGDNKILVAGGYELGATMIQIDKAPDGSFSAKEVFTTKQFGDQTKAPLLHEGHFYAEYGTNSRRDGLVCMDMNGDVLWKTKRDPDFNKGSMILVDGLILATDGSMGLYLIDPNPEGYKQLASARVLAEVEGPEGSDIASRVGGRTQNWAPLALSDGKLLVRDQKVMKCLAVK